MKTRISSFCDAIIEAGWLLAVIVAPLFFNLYSSRVFEPDKIAILRSIATLMSVALLTRWIEQTNGKTLGQRMRETLKTPLVLPALLSAVTFILATAFSVAPRVSLWGSYQRMQGTWTWVSYLVIFASLLTSLNTRKKVDRLLNTIILTSLPIALYGIIQHYHLDPLPWGGDVTFRVASNLGNAIFVAAYLIMVIPLSISKLVTLNQEQTEKAPDSAKTVRLITTGLVLVQTLVWVAVGYGWGLFAGLAGIVGVAAYASQKKLNMKRLLCIAAFSWILAAQLCCVFYSQSRGPWLGLAAGLVIYALVAAYRLRWRSLLFLILALAVLLGGFLGWLNLSQSALANSIREIPYIGRLGELLSVEDGTGKVRVLIWQGAADMAFDDPVHTLIGHGPETMYVAYPPFYDPDLAHYESRNATPDRSHNEMFDTLVTTGLLGFVTYLFVFIGAFYLALKWMGLVPDNRHRNLLIGLFVVLGLLGIMVPWMLDGSLRYAGVGLPIGILLSMGIYVLATALTEPIDPAATTEPWRVILVGAILTAMVAHWVEIHLGIAIVATRTIFWILAGMLVVVTCSSMPVSQSNTTTRARGKTKRRNSTARTSQDGIIAGILSGTLGCVLIWDYVTNPTGLSDPIKILIQSFTTMAALQQPNVPNLAIPGLVIASVCIGIAVLTAEHSSRNTDNEPDTFVHNLVIALFTAVGMTIIYGLMHASSLDTRESIHNLIYGFAALIAIIWVTLALVLNRKKERPRQISRSAMSLFSIPLLIAALLLCNDKNLANIRADVVYKEGLRYDSAGMWEQAASIYSEAVALNPTEDYYRLFEGRALLQLATGQDEMSTRELYFEKALAALEKAANTAPLNPDHAANIARLYSHWAQLTTNPALRQERFEASLAAYERASTLSPFNVGILNEWAITLAELARYDGAMALLEHSLSLDATYAGTLHAVGEVHYRQGKWEQALLYYEKVANHEPDEPALSTAVAHCYANLEDWDSATTWYSRAVALTPESAQAWLYLGNAQENSGAMANATLSYIQANALSPGSETVLKRLASASIQSGDLGTAESVLNQLLQQIPDDWALHHDLALVYSEQGRLEEALLEIELARTTTPTEELARIQALANQIDQQREVKP